MRCLILDDDASSREVLELVLRVHDHVVMSCGTLFEAVQAVAEQEFDVAIVDLEMPDTSTTGAIETVRRVAPNTKILVVSGHSAPTYVSRALRAGADGYVVKDELGDALIEAIEAVHRGRQPMSPSAAAVARRLRIASDKG